MKKHATGVSFGPREAEVARHESACLTQGLPYVFQYVKWPLPFHGCAGHLIPTACLAIRSAFSFPGMPACPATLWNMTSSPLPRAAAI